MPWSDSLPQFSLAGTVLTVLLLVFAAVGEPLLGRRAFRWLSRRRDDDPRALTRVHTVTIGIHALWGLAVVGVLLLSPGLSAGDLGLRPPHAWGPIAAGAVGGLLALGVLWVLVNGLPRGGRGRRGRRPAPAPLTLPEPERQRGLLVPYGTAERAFAAGAAVTGGVFGELLYRGLFIVLVASMGVPLWVAAVLSVVLFSVAHLYQGWWGLVSAGASGTLFTVLYLGTGSVWVPVLVHVALNLRSLVFPPRSVREAWYDDDYDDDYDDESPEAPAEDAYEEPPARDGYATPPGGYAPPTAHGSHTAPPAYDPRAMPPRYDPPGPDAWR
ncbi:MULTISPECIES: CPBP family intramembrane glutamic endopeptidase [unclassified Nocardiopsis]|uniref:CPBP family intramembrane glutamic endopeptidase n=1 Tax=unclassified Nocardiopsis TaxID=2649073 RepID=UPI001F1C0AD7|nr:MULTISPECIES: type II CAAX endopeptidase family protein [unclassified Nocardiopsis]